MNKQTNNPKRRWRTFSLRTFFLAVTIFCVWLGLLVDRVNKQKRAVAWVEELGGIVYYDFQLNEDYTLNEDARSPGPDWLRDMVGIDYFADVEYVDLKQEYLDLKRAEVADLAMLAALTDLRFLAIVDTEVSDLSPLSPLTRLQVLKLAHTQVSDLSPLVGMTGMRFLDLCESQVSDLSPLVGMSKMQWLRLSGTQVSNLSPLSSMMRLQELLLGGTQVTDLSALSTLTQLQGLYLSCTPVRDLSPLTDMTQARFYLDEGQPIKVPPELKTQVVQDNSFIW